MKVIFLDIDGVLNKDGTKERIPDDSGVASGLIGVDARLRDLLLGWLKGKDIQIVLSSTWRYLDSTKDELKRNGISWIAETPSPSAIKGIYHSGIRGAEIEEILKEGKITHYAILDDLGPYSFLQHQRRFLVQTSERWGLQDKHLRMLEKILCQSSDS